MIKNIKDLSHLELEELKTLYLEYFKEYDENELRGFARLLGKLLSKKEESYVDEMINRVVCGEYIGVTLYDYSIKDKEDVMVGFAVGHSDEEKDLGWLSHFYVSKESDAPSDRIYQKKLALELYSAIAEEFKKMGKTRIATELGAREYALRDILESLDFAPIHDYDDGHQDYGRKL